MSKDSISVRVTLSKGTKDYFDMHKELSLSGTTEMLLQRYIRELEGKSSMIAKPKGGLLGFGIEK